MELGEHFSRDAVYIWMCLNDRESKNQIWKQTKKKHCAIELLYYELPCLLDANHLTYIREDVVARKLFKSRRIHIKNNLSQQKQKTK
jgi:hypothetical protein